METFRNYMGWQPPVCSPEKRELSEAISCCAEEENIEQRAEIAWQEMVRRSIVPAHAVLTPNEIVQEEGC